ncbi:MAG TPA: adenosyl-hopene transferase HpnH [Rhodospirillaceae bacterium]|nr:hopanoid biosynthesis associated radical SAM protein HpnH [Rhodospirillaceae bacterium]HAT34956.1 adenosyl-hopene transferase HpnH [Rhodospirillaceae bacterium]
MSVPVIQQYRVATYILKQRLRGNKQYPLVLMLEPLFRCNLACPGCGKIDYPNPILNQRLSYEDCMQAVDECGAPMVSIPGGEPLLHREMKQIVEGIIARKKFVYLCTNAMLLEKKLDQFTPTKYLTFSVHLDGLEDHHDKAVNQAGVFKRASSAIKEAKRRGFRVNVNCTLFDQMTAEEAGEFFDYATDELGVDAITVSPGYEYERAPDQEHFLSRRKTKNLFREIFKIAHEKGRKWPFSASPLFLNFLAGNEKYLCTPWGMPTRNVFGWQRPCYLLSEGYANSFKELIEETEWEKYGTGNYEKCANCMVHCGYEATAVNDTFDNPLKALKLAMRSIRTDGEMAPEIDLSNQREPEYVHEEIVDGFMARLEAEDAKHGGDLKKSRLRQASKPASEASVRAA